MCSFYFIWGKLFLNATAVNSRINFTQKNRMGRERSLKSSYGGRGEQCGLSNSYVTYNPSVVARHTDDSLARAAQIKVVNSFFPTDKNTSCDQISWCRKKENQMRGQKTVCLLVWRMAHAPHATVRHLCLAAKSADSGNSRILRGEFGNDWTLLCDYYLSCFYWYDRLLLWVFSSSSQAIHITVLAVDVSLLFGPLCCRRFTCHGAP